MPTDPGLQRAVALTISVDTVRDLLAALDLAPRDSGGAPAWQAGGFTEALVGAMRAADQHNLARFALGWPELTTAFRLYREWDDGVEALFDRAGWPLPDWYTRLDQEPG